MISRLIKPRLVVFDLDHTLWPLGVDAFSFKPPYSRQDSTLQNRLMIADSNGVEMKPFPQVNQLLNRISLLNIQMGIASRTTFPVGALQLVSLFGWDGFFTYKEIYPGSKVAHFSEFQQKSGIDYKDMLFFDDEQRNIDDIAPLGVTAILVNPVNGVTLEEWQRGLEQFSSRASPDRASVSAG